MFRKISHKEGQEVQEGETIRFLRRISTLLLPS
jgi:hypothetical protein